MIRGQLTTNLSSLLSLSFNSRLIQWKNIYVKDLTQFDWSGICSQSNVALAF